MEIADKSVIVTGGAGGIGSKVIELLLEKKAFVAAVDINKEGLDKLKNNCTQFNDNLKCYCGDVGDVKFVQEVTNHFFNISGIFF